MLRSFSFQERVGDRWTFFLFADSHRAAEAPVETSETVLDLEEDAVVLLNLAEVNRISTLKQQETAA